MPKTVCQCAYCNHVLKTTAGITKHEKQCTLNPTVSKAEKTKQNLNAEIEDIRINATDIPDLMARLDKFFLSKGLQVTFTDYPTIWLDSVSNSHNAPKGYKQNWCGRGDKENIPRGYPGWTGNFSGTIKVIDPTILNIGTKISFNDITGSWNSRVMSIPFLQTGSGSFGDNFRGEGKLFLYDFPKMHSAWKANKGEYKELCKTYDTTLRNLHTEYNNNLNTYVTSHTQTKKIEELISKTASFLSSLKTVKTGVTSYVKNEFNTLHPFNIPAVPSAFVNINQIKRIENETTVQNLDAPDLSSSYQYLKTLATEIDTYKSKYPEYFI